MDDHDRKFGLFINNQWVHPEERKFYETKSPGSGDFLAKTTQGTVEDVESAVIAASEAHKSWSKLSGVQRSKHLYNIARTVQKHARLVAVVEALDNGKSIRETRDADVPTVIRHIYHYAGWAQIVEESLPGWESIGVVGAIVPWNFPLMLLTWKVAPALAMGNTVVLKPATYTRLSALLFAELCAEAGLPAGVFNVVTGGGAMGQVLAEHRLVQKVAFTGSTEIGKVCSAGSKLIVQETIFTLFTDKIKKRLQSFRIGKSLDKCIDMAAIVDETQRKSVSEYVEEARAEGADIFQIEAPPGCFYPPTLITGVNTASKVVMEEIFGPVLVALPFRTAKEAIALANNTMYGLE